MRRFTGVSLLLVLVICLHPLLDGWQASRVSAQGPLPILDSLRMRSAQTAAESEAQFNERAQMSSTRLPVGWKESSTSGTRA